MRDISLREISNATKISVRMLEGIENNNYSILPGGVFNRNFLRAYADFVGLDPEEVVRKYELMMSQITEDEIQLPGLVTTPPWERSSEDKKLRRRMILAVVALILVLLAVLATLLFWKPGFYWRLTAGPAAVDSELTP